MRNLRWWAPVSSLVVALAFGFIPYAALTYSGKIPPGLRDNPWPMEVIATLATVATLYLAAQAYRQKRLRIVATISAVVALLGLALFFQVVHVVSYQLPGAPKEIAVGVNAPDFELPDSQGKSFSLASKRGQPVLLVFHRGVW